MPIFTFIIRDSAAPARDPIQVELDSREHAREEAIATLAGLAKDVLPNGDQHDFSARVMDEAGTSIFEAQLSLRGHWL